MRCAVALSKRGSVVLLLAGLLLIAGCGDDETGLTLPTGATSTPTNTSVSTATRTSTPTPTSTSPAAAPTATNTATSAPATETPTATPTSTTTAGASIAGDYHGTDSTGAIAVRFTVTQNLSASGFLDFLSSAAAAIQGNGRAADVVFSIPVTGQAQSTGEYQLTGTNAGTPFTISGQLPSAPNTTGTFSVTLAATAYDGDLMAGAAPTPLPTATATAGPGCDTASLNASFSGVSGDFNGTAIDFVAERAITAIEQKAPDFIAGFHETYNSTFNVTDCADTRNVQISLSEAPGGLAAGQTFTVGETTGMGALVYYGQQVSGDSVWSSSAGTVVIDSVNGSVVTLHVVAAAMTVPAGNAAGSFTLDVTGQVNNFARQPD